MNLIDLTPQALKRAAAIKEQIQALSNELTQLLGDGAPSKNASSRNRLSPKARRNIAAAQQARWAKFRASRKSAATPNAAKSKSTSSANSKRSAKMKAYWAAKKAAKSKK